MTSIQYGLVESCFVDPDNFIPERWYSKPAGTRECVGKRLANTVLRLVLATLVRHYNIEFAPGYDPDTIWRDMEDKLSAKPGNVLCVFKPL